jgi:hypothetical protein
MQIDLLRRRDFLSFNFEGADQTQGGVLSGFSPAGGADTLAAFRQLTGLAMDKGMNS